MIRPLNIATKGYLCSPLSVVSDGYLCLEVVVNQAGGSNIASPRATNIINERANFIRRDDDEVVLLMKIFTRCL